MRKRFFKKIYIESLINIVIVLAKRLSEKQKKEIIKGLFNGKTLDQLSKEFNYTELTISRNLKKNLGEEKYKNIINQNKLNKKSSIIAEKSDVVEAKYDSKDIDNFDKNIISADPEPLTTFVEIAPLNEDIDNSIQKDLSSISILDVTFPKTVYMVVDKTIELEIKSLRDYPEWHFLPQSDLDRKTIEVYLDLKVAKRFCNKEQKVIKVPNTDVFKKAAHILISRGISRIISADQLIAL